MKRFIVGALFLFISNAYVHAQTEMSKEIDKLETGKVEDKKSVVPQDPTDSANQVEKELDQEAAKPNTPEASPTQDELPTAVDDANAPQQAADSLQEIKPDQQPTEEQTQVPAETTPAATPAPVPVEEIVTTPEEVPPPPAAEEPAPTPTPIEQANVTPPEKESGASAFEQRLNKIYNRFYAEGTSDQSWTQIAGEKINETYTIQPGDTLWDVSVTFFGNGFYWPKVWAMNDEITNPHALSAGYILKFTPGKMDKAPQINLSKTDAAKPEATVAKEDGPIIPPTDVKHIPLLKNLPPSLPYINGPKYSGFDEDGFSVETKKISIQDARVFLPSYLSEEEPTHIGKVVEFEDADQGNATLYDIIYIRFENPVQPGERFVTYHLGDKIYDMHGVNQGRPVVLEGDIQIMGLVNSEKNVYRARVLKAVNFVQQDSYVMRGSLIEGNLSETNDSSNVSAEIVGGAFDSTRKIAGDQDVVYLSKGSQEGVREGQIFDVFKNMDARKSSTYIHDLKEKIARLKVIKVTPERSTAIILKASGRVLVGDFIGAKEIARNDEIKDLDFDKDSSSDSKDTSLSSPSDDLQDSDLTPDSDQKSDSDDNLISE